MLLPLCAPRIKMNYQNGPRRLKNHRLETLILAVKLAKRTERHEKTKNRKKLGKPARIEKRGIAGTPGTKDLERRGKLEKVS